MVTSRVRSGLCAIVAVLPFLTALNRARADFLTYRAATGQSGTAEFTFRDASNLEIRLTDTTGSEIAGSSGILTSIGVRLPDSAIFLRAGTVKVGSGSSSNGFSTGVFTSGVDVSGEWGVTVRGESDLRGAGKYDQVSTLEAKGLKRFQGSNRDGKKSLAGAQGGLSRSAKQGMGVINNSVLMRLTIDANLRKRGIQGLSSEQQAAFLANLFASSVLEFGIGAALAYPVAVDPLVAAIQNTAIDAVVVGDDLALDTASFSALETESLGLGSQGPTEILPATEPIWHSSDAVGALPGPDLALSNWSDSLGRLPVPDSSFNELPATTLWKSDSDPLAGSLIIRSDFADASVSQAFVTAQNPEPSSICLLAIGAATLMGYRFTRPLSHPFPPAKPNRRPSI